LSADAARPGARWLAAARTPLLVALVAGLAASISVAQIALGVLAVWVLLARRTGLLGPLRWPLLLPITAYAGWSVVAALASPQPTESLYECKNLLTLAAVFVLANALPDPPTARRFVHWLLLAVSVVAAIAVLQVSACPDLNFSSPATSLVGRFFRKCGRARGFYSIYMTLAGVLAMALTAALPRLARPGREVRWLAPAFVVDGIALALTYVRGAWVGLAVGALAAVAGLGRRGVVAAVALVVLGGGLVLALPQVRQRAASIADPNNDTARDRMAMAEVGLRLAGEHPVTGVGPGQVKRLYPSLAPPEAMRHSTSHLHNTPLQIVAERGVVGLATWLWILVAFFRRAIAVLVRLPADAAEDRTLVLGAIGALVTFVVGGLFEYNWGDTEVLMVALAFVAVPFAVAGARLSADPCAPA
jgi:putative inorganic carbon (hco3(-)) transporter